MNELLMEMIKIECKLDDQLGIRNGYYNRKYTEMSDAVRYHFLQNTMALANAKTCLATSIKELQIYTNTKIRNHGTN